jgi:hypothetical protein
MANVNMMIEPRFSAEVFGAETARALDALLALEGCVSADTMRGGVVATESVPFARPTGVSMYEADALTWRFYQPGWSLRNVNSLRCARRGSNQESRSSMGTDEPSD